eukprot:4183382-Alexandrium_andersonii.AAC.1
MVGTPCELTVTSPPCHASPPFAVGLVLTLCHMHFRREPLSPTVSSMCASVQSSLSKLRPGF